MSPYSLPDMAPFIRRARPEDAATLTVLAHAAKRHWGYPDHWIALWADALTFTPLLIAENETYVAVADGALLGVYSLDGNGPVCTLEHLWVHPAAMGHGMGRHLFRHAVARATTRGASRLVIESDPHAEGFYRRMGARRTGTHRYMLDGQPRILPVLTVDL